MYLEESDLELDQIFMQATSYRLIRDRYHQQIEEMVRKKKSLLKEKDKLEKNARTHPKKLERIYEKINGIKYEVKTLIKLGQDNHFKHLETLKKYDDLRDDLKRRLGFRDRSEIKAMISDIERHLDASSLEQRRLRTKYRNELIEYVLMCPFSEREEIVEYLMEFSLPKKIWIDDPYLIELFHYSFCMDDPLIRPALLYRTLSIFSSSFGIWLQENKVRFFRDMIVGMKDFDYKIGTKGEYEKFESNFMDQFGLEPPLRVDVMRWISKDPATLNLISLNPHIYERIYSIFAMEESDLMRELDRSIISIREKRGILIPPS